MPRPFVTANFAITADGRISTKNRTPANFSSPRDKHRLLEIRATCDAILAGLQTIAKDNMTMGLPDDALRAERRAKGMSEYPVRVLVSNRGQIDPGLRVFAKDFSPIVVFTTQRMKPALQDALAPKADLHLFPERVDLAAMLEILHREYAIRRLVCEGGASLFRSLLEADLVDELHLTVVPRIFGSKKAPTLTGPAGDFLPKSTQLRLRDFHPEGDECFLRYSVK